MRGWRDFRVVPFSLGIRSQRRLPGERCSLHRRNGVHYPKLCHILYIAVRRDRTCVAFQTARRRNCTLPEPYSSVGLGQQGGEMKNPPCQSAWRVSETFCELFSLFSSFLRGASCPKSPRVAATAAVLLCLKMREMSRNKARRAKKVTTI